MGVDGVPAAGEIDGLMSTVDPELAPAGAARAASQRATTAMTPKTVRPRERVEVRSATFPRSCCMRAWVDPGPKEHRRLLSLIHISEPTRLGMISYAVFCLKKKNTKG